MVDLTTLNDSQKEAVLHTDGPVMVLAGAGSGKTRTLVTRIMYLIEEKMVSPYKVLALTFSNKAAREMRERVAIATKVDIGALRVTTFHSFCANLLRSESSYLGLSKSFTIYDDSESKVIVKSILARYGFSPKDLSPYEVLHYISNLKNIGHYLSKDDYDKESVDKDDDFYKFYIDYETELSKANAVDFGGLITGVIELFEKHPDVLDRYLRRFEYVLIDEYQDTNRCQFKLMELLSKGNRNVCVVGDEDQSIYSWRGADIRNILDFETVFPDYKLIKLEQNYRSSKTIIDAATCVITHNEMRKGKDMWTNNSEGDLIKVVECANDKIEAEFIAQKIKDYAASGASYDDIAVFYRMNSQSRVIEDYLRTSRIPYRVIGGVKFYDRKEIKDLVSYLRVIVNPRDSLSLSRVINAPTRGIGAVSLRKIEEQAINNSQSLWEVMFDIVNNPENYTHIKLSAKVRKGLATFVALIEDAQYANSNGEKPSVIYEKILHESGYLEALVAKADYESKARVENLEEFSSAFVQFESENEAATLTDFLETITLDTTEKENEDDSSGQVCLMTIHGSKGLEFPYVFLTGAEENIFPSFQSIEEGDDRIEEERRLFYVAMTRAMTELNILFAQGRLLFGSVKFNGPSRFLDEIPKSYTEKILKGAKTHSSIEGKSFELDSINQSSDFLEPAYVVESSYSQAKFPKGSKVIHGLYGKGTVLDSEGSGSDEKVMVKFIDNSKKRFMVKFAPLSLDK